jgi:AcrR family transcriptional regulator
VKHPDPDDAACVPHPVGPQNPLTAAVRALKRGRPQSAEAGRVILEATLQLLDEERSVAGLSMEAVAHRAGVGKATVYRRWPNKEALVVAAMETLEVPAPELTGDVREDLVAILETVRQTAVNTRFGGLLSLFHEELRAYPELHDRYHEVVVEKRRAVLVAFLRRSVAAGELRDDIPLDLMVDMIVGPLVLRKLHGQTAELGPELPGQIADTLLGGMRADPAGGAGTP